MKTQTQAIYVRSVDCRIFLTLGIVFLTYIAPILGNDEGLPCFDIPKKITHIVESPWANSSPQLHVQIYREEEGIPNLTTGSTHMKDTPVLFPVPSEHKAHIKTSLRNTEEIVPALEEELARLKTQPSTRFDNIHNPSDVLAKQIAELERDIEVLSKYGGAPSALRTAQDTLKTLSKYFYIWSLELQRWLPSDLAESCKKIKSKFDATFYPQLKSWAISEVHERLKTNNTLQDAFTAAYAQVETLWAFFSQTHTQELKDIENAFRDLIQLRKEANYKRHMENVFPDISGHPASIVIQILLLEHWSRNPDKLENLMTHFTLGNNFSPHILQKLRVVDPEDASHLSKIPTTIHEFETLSVVHQIRALKYWLALEHVLVFLTHAQKFYATYEELRKQIATRRIGGVAPELRHRAITVLIKNTWSSDYYPPLDIPNNVSTLAFVFGGMGTKRSLISSLEYVVAQMPSWAPKHLGDHVGYMAMGIPNVGHGGPSIETIPDLATYVNYLRDFFRYYTQNHRQYVDNTGTKRTRKFVVLARSTSPMLIMELVLRYPGLFDPNYDALVLMSPVLPRGYPKGVPLPQDIADKALRGELILRDSTSPDDSYTLTLDDISYVYTDESGKQVRGLDQEGTNNLVPIAGAYPFYQSTYAGRVYKKLFYYAFFLNQRAEWMNRLEADGNLLDIPTLVGYGDLDEEYAYVLPQTATLFQNLRKRVPRMTPLFFRGGLHNLMNPEPENKAFPAFRSIFLRFIENPHRFRLSDFDTVTPEGDHVSFKDDDLWVPPNIQLRE